MRCARIALAGLLGVVPAMAVGCAKDGYLLDGGSDDGGPGGAESGGAEQDGQSAGDGTADAGDAPAEVSAPPRDATVEADGGFARDATTEAGAEGDAGGSLDADSSVDAVSSADAPSSMDAPSSADAVSGMDQAIPCGPSTCAGGCCDTNGSCVTTMTGNQCGTHGAMCGPCATVQVYETSRSAGAGGTPEHVADKGMVSVATGAPQSGLTTVTVDVGTPRQSVLGFGAALTEASGSVVLALNATTQQEFFNAYFGSSGSGYTLARTHIGSCDFALAQYSYDDTGPDPTLANFSIAHDQAILIPFIKLAMQASGGALKLFSSPWSAPGWMKDNGVMQGSGTDGSLLTQYYGAYATYLSKYIQAYAAAGLPIWAISTQDEPLGVGGSREGMDWTPAQMNTFIRDNLGPQLKADKVSNTLVFFFDYNKDAATPSVAVTWANTILGDATTNSFVAGTAFHWYDSTFQTYDGTMDAVHAIDTSKSILFDEAAADALGDTGYGAYSTSYKYSWMSDDFYWTKSEGDWGFWYAATPSDHPKYEPAYRYARDIIAGLNHWYTGFIDWNAVLNKDGGPGHIVNPLPAGIMVDTTAGSLYYTPIFYVMQQFSKFIRPQAVVATTKVQLASGVQKTDYDGTPTPDGNALLAAAAKNSDNSVAIVLFNETNAAIDYAVVIGGNNVTQTIPAQSMQTLVWK